MRAGSSLSALLRSGLLEDEVGEAVGVSTDALAVGLGVMVGVTPCVGVGVGGGDVGVGVGGGDVGVGVMPCVGVGDGTTGV